MNRLLLIVADTFLLPGPELAVLPGIDEQPGERFRIGDPLLLKRPDGSELATTIGNLSIPNPNPRSEWLLGFTNLSKDDVPIGTEVWSV